MLLHYYSDDKDNSSFIESEVVCHKLGFGTWYV